MGSFKLYPGCMAQVAKEDWQGQFWTCNPRWQRALLVIACLVGAIFVLTLPSCCVPICRGALRRQNESRKVTLYLYVASLPLEHLPEGALLAVHGP